MRVFRTARRSVVIAAIGVLSALSIARLAGGPASAAAVESTASQSCVDHTVPLSVEERRLSFRLPRNDNPAVLQSSAFATEMINAAGFEGFAPQLIGLVCRAQDLQAVRAIVVQQGERLWFAAVDRAQRRGRVRGDLPYSDDRPLYWARLECTAALRQARLRFRLSVQTRLSLITMFDKASRGMFAIHFPAGRSFRRIILSGFDPYTLDGGPSGTAPGAAGDNIRHGNPSGATALALDGTRFRTPDGKIEVIETYILPVNYLQFREGYLEDTVGLVMKPSPRQVYASITMSQANGAEFDLEQWNGRYHGVTIGNDDLAPCPNVNGVPQLPLDNPGCDISVVRRWGGPGAFELSNPPQWTHTTLPIGRMIAANAGRGIPRPSGDPWPDHSVAFGVVWHTQYLEFPSCSSPAEVTRNEPVPTAYPPPTPPVAPDPGSCAYQGGGGNYLSNESAYRNTLLRDRLRVPVLAGHVHTPFMQYFSPGNLYNPSDATFDAWRVAIVAQAKRLVHVVGETPPVR